MPPPPNPLQLCASRGFSYSVFVSWPHKISQRGREIVGKLVKGLEDSYENFPGSDKAGVFFDDRLVPGYKWNETLRRKLCRSAVTLVVLVPSYFESSYCALEWGITEKLEASRIPAGSEYTAFISLGLFSAEELNPPTQVSAIQFAKEFAELIVFGQKVEDHPRWLDMIESLRRLVFDRIKAICAQGRDNDLWQREEEAALGLQAYEFTWPSDPMAADLPFPQLRAVERKL
jgi:hypothetical protein